MSTFTFGPLKVLVESVGIQVSAWGGAKELTYYLKVSDDHGNTFESFWAAQGVSEEEVAMRIVNLLWASTDRDFQPFGAYFSGGYSGNERLWRSREASKISASAKTFDQDELLKASGIAYREREYRGRGPRDWSPRRRLPDE